MWRLGEQLVNRARAKKQKWFRVKTRELGNEEFSSKIWLTVLVWDIQDKTCTFIIIRSIHSCLGFDHELLSICIINIKKYMLVLTSTCLHCVSKSLLLDYKANHLKEETTPFSPLDLPYRLLNNVDRCSMQVASLYVFQLWWWRNPYPVFFSFTSFCWNSFLLHLSLNLYGFFDLMQIRASQSKIKLCTTTTINFKG